MGVFSSLEGEMGEPKFKAELRGVRDSAGQSWWGRYLESRAQEVNRRFKQAKVVYWSPAEKMPLDLFSYIREAGLCFSVARFLATIVLSSTAVELVVNRDRRTRSNPTLRRIGGMGHSQQ